MLNVTNYTEFRKNMTSYFNDVVNKGVNLIIPRGNEEAVVVMSLSEFNKNKMDETEFLMSNKKDKALLLKGVEDFKKGKNLVYVEWDDENETFVPVKEAKYAKRCI